MSNAKIEIKIGEITFSGEGEPIWLTKQLDKILDKAEKLMALTTSPAKAQPATKNIMTQATGPTNHGIGTGTTLATWLKSKNSQTGGRKKFLATAVWLTSTQGRHLITTKDVTSALSTASQSRLGNAAECLNQNCKQGFCQKEGGQFFVTEEGRNTLGI